MSALADIRLEDIHRSMIRNCSSLAHRTNSFPGMRAQSPVLWNRPTDRNDGFWSITGFEDDLSVINDWKTFSSSRRGIFLEEEGILPKDFNQFLFSMMDPPEHDKHRLLLTQVFTPLAPLPSGRMTSARSLLGCWTT